MIKRTRERGRVATFSFFSLLLFPFQRSDLEADPAAVAWLDTVICAVCGEGHDEDLLLLCDGEGVRRRKKSFLSPIPHAQNPLSKPPVYASLLFPPLLSLS